jgi:hypothetical protein
MKHEIVSRPYKNDTGSACEACVFGRGEHAVFCPKRPAPAVAVNLSGAHENPFAIRLPESIEG